MLISLSNKKKDIKQEFDWYFNYLHMIVIHLRCVDKSELILFFIFYVYLKQKDKHLAEKLDIYSKEDTLQSTRLFWTLNDLNLVSSWFIST